MLTLFYGVEKPFASATVFALGQTTLDLVVVGWLTLLALAGGHRLLCWLALDNLSTGEQLILGSGLGFGMLGLLTLALGLVGLLYPALFIGLTILLTGLLWSDWRELVRQARRWRPALPDRWLAVYIGLIGLVSLGLALRPPTDWDGLFYHLTAPKIFIAQHQIVSGIDVPHFNFPFLAEMLFTYAMLLRGDITAKLIHVVFAFLLTGLVYLMAVRFLHRRAGWRAVLILLSMPMILTLASWAYNDLMLAFYQLAALYTLFRAKSSAQSIRWLIVTGLLSGLAMGVKYTSFVGPLFIGLVLIYWLVKQIIVDPKTVRLNIDPTYRAGATALCAFVVPAMLVAAPWYLKNYFFTGNPVYPFVFGGLFWDEFRAVWYAQPGTGIAGDWVSILGLPIWLTLNAWDANPGDGRTGPLFLLFLPLILLYGLFRYRTPRFWFRSNQTDHNNLETVPWALDLLMLFALAQFAFWTLGALNSRTLWQSRLLLPCIVAFAPVVGWIWHDLKHLDLPQFSLQRFVNLLIGLVLVFNSLTLLLHVIEQNPLAYITGAQSKELYLNRNLGAHYQAITSLNDLVPPDAVVLFLWEPRSYYCDVTCRPDSILDRLAHDHHKHQTPSAIAQAWRDEGITHVLLFRAGLEFVIAEQSEPLSAEAVSAFATIETEYLTELELEGSGAYQLYRLE
ncbi:glycosyltransferase family 39 protein [Anaerolineales bacterium HSG6]|nr:glycosyltransferase family 39 protein [Anaerolineales bacterium HSG6]